MAETKNLNERWTEYQPSKKIWFWSCAGSVVATIVAGFWFGGWVTGGTAASMAEKAADVSRAELAAAICVERFTSAPNFRMQLATLEEKSRWQRDNFIDDGGWTTFGDRPQPVKDAGALCAEQLLAMDVPEAAAVNTGASGKLETVEQ